jgi:peroxiredoxin Q/BCP
LQKKLPLLEEKKVSLVGLSYDSVDVLSRFAREKKITYPLLSDPDHAAIVSFGLLNREAVGKAVGVPYPGIMILDREGTIRAKLFYDDYRDRHTAEDIVKALGKLR